MYYTLSYSVGFEPKDGVNLTIGMCAASPPVFFSFFLGKHQFWGSDMLVSVKQLHKIMNPVNSQNLCLRLTLEDLTLQPPCLASKC